MGEFVICQSGKDLWAEPLPISSLDGDGSITRRGKRQLRRILIFRNMKGSVIYLIFRNDINRGGLTLIAPHATFDGAHMQMLAERTYWEDHGALIHYRADGSFVVEFGQNKWDYYVVTRTIEL